MSLYYLNQEGDACMLLEFIHHPNMKVGICSICCSTEVSLYKEEKTQDLNATMNIN